MLLGFNIFYYHLFKQYIDKCCSFQIQKIRTTINKKKKNNSVEA